MHVRCLWKYPAANYRSNAAYGPIIIEGDIERLSLEPLAELLRPALRTGRVICIPVLAWVEMMKELLDLPPEGGTVEIDYKGGILIQVEPVR